MGKKKELATLDPDSRNYMAGKAFALRLDGTSVDDIAVSLNLSPMEVQELVRVAYGRLSVQSAEEARADVEERLNSIMRKVNTDIALAHSQAERTALYRVLLSVERDRATLLGLDVPKGTPDA